MLNSLYRYRRGVVAAEIRHHIPGNNQHRDGGELVYPTRTKSVDDVTTGSIKQHLVCALSERVD